MNIFCLTNNTGSKYYRLIPQLKHLQELGHKVIMEPHNASNIDQKIKWADLVIFQMVFSKDWIDFAKKEGKKIIFECDDLIHIVPKTHYSYKETKGLKKIKWLWDIYKVLRKCDGFISTTKRIDNNYGWMARKSLIFPNYCDLSHWLKEYKENNTDKVRMLWAGSTSHTGDLIVMKPLLKKVLEKYPQLQFVYVGHGGIKSKDLMAQFIYGDDLFNGLPDNRESLLPVPANIWPYILASIQADFAIAPLEENYFNGGKSTCKYLEYSINKIPAIYAGWHYKDVKDGKTGFLAYNEEDWLKYIDILVKDAELRKSMGDKAYNDMLENHDIRAYLNDWSEFVLNI